MKEINRLGWSMLLLMSFILFGASSAKALSLPIDEGFTPEAKTEYTFTTVTGGTLTLTTTGDKLFPGWLSTPMLSVNGNGVNPSYTNGDESSFLGASEIQWELAGGNTYVFYLDVDKTPEDLGTYKFTYTGEYGEGNTEPEQPGGNVSEPIIDPAPPTLASGEWWPNQITVSWDGQTVTTNPASPSYDDGYISFLPTLLNGQTLMDPEWGEPANIYARGVYYADMGGWGYWDDADAAHPATAIAISGFPYFDSAPRDGETLQVTLPAGSVIVNGQTNQALVIKYTVGKVDYDDSKVKTYGSTVTFDRPGTCDFITREDEMSTLSIVTNSTENLSEYISMVYKVDPNDSSYDKAYSFDAVKMANGCYAYNFKSVTYNQMVFTYTGSVPVTFTFQKEFAQGEQEGGLKNMGDFEFGKQFTINQNEVYTYTFRSLYSGSTYIKIDTPTNVLQNGTLTVMNNADFSIIDGWKSGTTFDLIAANDGTYGYTGSLNISYVPYTVYVAYTGAQPLTLTIGEGEFTEFGVAEYLEPANQTPTSVSEADSNAVITLDWGEEMEVIRADATMRYYINGVEELGSYFEFSNFMYFEGDNVTDDDPESTVTIKNGSKGDKLNFRFGAALSGDLQVGTYGIVLPSGVLRNSKGNLNCEQMITVVVQEAPEEPEGTNVTLSFTGVENAWQLITLLDGNTAAPIDLDGATYNLSFNGDDAALLVGINSEYDLAITAEGVQQTYDTFMVGEIDTMDDMDVYPVTIYPGLNGKTLVFTVSKEEAPEATATKLYVVKGPNMDEIAEANPATDPVLELQDNGNYVGSFEIEGMNAAFRFYSYVDGVYTYYSPESGGFAGNLWTSFANGTVTTNGLFESTSPGGSWRINGYPEGSIGGIVTAVVDLGSTYDTEITKLITDAVTTLSFEPTVSGTPDLPEELLVVTDGSDYGSFMPTTVGATVATFKLGEDGTYEGDFTIANRPFFKFYAVENGVGTYYAATGGYNYVYLDFDLEDTYSYNTINSGSASGVGGWRVNANTTIHAVVDLAKNTITLSKAEGQEGPGENYPAAVYLAWGPDFNNVSISIYDQQMKNVENGIYTASFEYSTSDTNKAFRLYSDENVVPNYISVQNGSNPWGMDERIYFADGLSVDYSNLFATTDGSNAGSWTIQNFPEGVTEGTIELTLNLVNKTLNVTLVPEEVKEPETVYIAFASHGSSITKGMLNPATDLQFTQQQDGSYLFEYELSDDTRDYFGFLMYTVDGSEYMSIGKQSGVGDWGQAEGIELPNVPGESLEQTFTGLKQYPVGPTTYDDQASFTFSAPTGFVSGNATLKLSADLQTLEVLVTTEGSSEPGIQLPEMIANPVDGSTLRNVFAAEPAVRWGENRLRLVNPQGFSVIQDNGNKNITSDFILQLVEYDPDENTSLEDVQAVISYLDIWPLAEGSYTYTINAGAVQINYNGQWVDCPQIVLHYTLGGQQTVTLPPATIVPEDGSKVTDLKNVTLSWPAFYVQQRGDGEGGMLKNITYTVNGGSPKVIDVTYEGNEAPGMEGYYSTIVLPINATESGKYVVTVPAGALYVASENAGSLENEEIVLTYDVTVTETPAPVYMTGGSVDPRDGSRLANMGDVYITWGNYTLDINPPANQDYVNLPLDKVTATLNGEKVNLNNMFGVIFRAINTQGSDEGTGGTSTFHVAEIQFYPGDLSFYWSGTLNLKFEEGLVKSTTGAISPAFDLTYYLGGQEVVSPAIFTPEEGSKFLPGEAVVYAEWEGYNVTAINGGVTLNTMNEEGEVGSSTSIGNSQLSIEGGKLKIDLASLPVGSYQMWLHQGAVDLGNNAVNADAPYAFSIALPEPEGPEATDIDPAINIADGKITISWDGNEIEITDDFSLTIIDNTTGEEVNIWDGVVTVDDNGNLVIDLEELELPEGDYTLTLAEGSVNIDEDGTVTYNNEVTYNFKSSAVGIVAADADVRYFTIDGLEVKNPSAGQILIRVVGNKVTKVLVK